MKDKKTVPDGGWGYACVVGLLQCQMLFSITVRAFGVIYLLTMEKFHTTATVTAWLGGFNALTWGAASPIASFFCQKYSSRIVTFAGTILLFSGFVLTAFANHIAMLYLSFGLMTGVGAACVTSSGYIIVTQYFDKKRALATSIGSAGGSVGILLLAPFINFMAEYYGFQGCMLIVAAICLQGFVSAALFRPLNLSTKTDTTTAQHKNGLSNKEKEEDEPNNLEYQYKKGLTKHLQQPHWTDSIESGINVDIVNQSALEVNKTQKETNSKCCSKASEIFGVLCEEPTIIGVILMNTAAPFSGTVMSTFGPALAVDENVSQTKAVLLLTWSGIADMVGRILFGYLMDISTLRPYRLVIYTCCGTLASISLLLFPLIPGSYIWYTCVYMFLNAFHGTMMAQRATVVADILGLKRMPTVFGILQFVNAIGLISGRIIGGLLKDTLGHYNYIFYLSGVFSISCCIVMFIQLFMHTKSKNKKKLLTKKYAVVNS